MIRNTINHQTNLIIFTYFYLKSTQYLLSKIIFSQNSIKLTRKANHVIHLVPTQNLGYKLKQWSKKSKLDELAIVKN